jgi:hypothetical protein
LEALKRCLDVVSRYKVAADGEIQLLEDPPNVMPHHLVALSFEYRRYNLVAMLLVRVVQSTVRLDGREERAKVRKVLEDDRDDFERKIEEWVFEIVGFERKDGQSRSVSTVWFSQS